jgi:ABC-type sulfate transport system permease subunit
MEHSYDGAEAGFAGVIIAFFIAFFWIFTLIWVISIVGMWKAFEKAGKPGWAALIPIYNLVVMIEIVGKPMIWVLWCLLPCVNWIFGIWVTNLISKSYGKDEGFTIGLLFLPFIFWPILGFGSAKYIGPSAAEARHNPFQPNNPFNQPPPPQA